MTEIILIYILMKKKDCRIIQKTKAWKKKITSLECELFILWSKHESPVLKKILFKRVKIAFPV